MNPLDAVSRLDLVLCVDVTGSMASFIAAAREHMTGILTALQEALGAGLRVGIVAYRDHCDGPRLLDVLPLDAEIARARTTLDALEVTGGGDAPEAVFAGLEACLGLAWSEGAYRVVVLVGDAPPHACGAHGDAHAAQDPTGWTLDDMANQLEADGVFVHALAMLPGDQVLQRAFRRIAVGTGGDCHDASTPRAAVAVIDALSKTVLRHMALDRRTLELVQHGLPVEAEEGPSVAERLARRLGVEPFDVSGSLTRLRQRRLLALSS